MICNKCKENTMAPVKGSGGVVEFECENCGNVFTKKYGLSNFSLEFLKDNY